MFEEHQMFKQSGELYKKLAEGGDFTFRDMYEQFTVSVVHLQCARQHSLTENCVDGQQPYRTGLTLLQHTHCHTAIYAALFALTESAEDGLTHQPDGHDSRHVKHPWQR